MLIDELLDDQTNLFEVDPGEIQDRKFQAIAETAKLQFKKCALYKQLCKQKNYDPNRDLKSYEDISNIPYLSTQNFKQKSGKPKDLLMVPESEIRVWGTSSGTSGDPSLIGRDKINLERFFKEFQYIQANINGLAEYDWSLDFMPAPHPHHTLDEKEPITISHFGYIFDIANILPLEQRNYCLKMAPGATPQKPSFVLDIEKVTNFLMSNPSERGKGWVAGSVPLMYGAIMQISQKTGMTFDLGEKSVVAIGGGWKVDTGEPVTKNDFRSNMSQILNISDSQIVDSYSFTETDVIFQECSEHNMHALPWSDVIIRDVETMQPVEIGEKGLINVINPCAYSYAGVSILQDDMARIVADDGCPCGRRGKYIEVIGRAQGAEAKGCGAQIAEMTKKSR